MFKKKMAALGISFRARGANNVKKVVAQSKYKIKQAAINGRPKEEVQEELEQRKRIRSEAKTKPLTGVKSAANMQKRDYSRK